jgi:hypothetical protein
VSVLQISVCNLQQFARDDSVDAAWQTSFPSCRGPHTSEWKLQKPVDILANAASAWFGVTSSM